MLLPARHDHAVLVAEVAVWVVAHRGAAEEETKARQLALHEEPGAAIGERVGPALGGEPQRFSHALADREIPGLRVRRRATGCLPERQFLAMGARLVAAAREHGAGFRDPAERVLRPSARSSRLPDPPPGPR